MIYRTLACYYDADDAVYVESINVPYHGSYCIRERESERASERERDWGRELFITPQPPSFAGAPSVVAVAAYDDFHACPV